MKRKSAARVIAAAAMCVGGQLALAGHQSSTWEIDAVGSWSDATKWSTNPVFPNNGGGNTFDATIDSTSSTLVTLDTNISINSLTFNLGRLVGNHTLSLQSDFLWYGGEVIGVGGINVASYMEIGGLDHQFALSTLTIAPAANVFWWGGGIDASDDNGGGGIINNDGLFVDETDSSWTWGAALRPVFNNGGTYLKQTGTPGSGKQIQAAFNNTGNIDVEQGDLWLAGGGTSSGLFTVAPDTRLMISDFNQNYSDPGLAPITTLQAGSSVYSLGTVEFSHAFGSATTEIYGAYDSAMTVIDPFEPLSVDNTIGQVTFHEGAVVNTSIVGDLRVQSGTVRFETGQGGIGFNGVSFVGGIVDTSDDLFFNTLDWSGGMLKGTSMSTSVSTGSMSITGTDPKSLVDVTLYNGVASPATMEAGEVLMQDAELRNLANASFDVQDGAVLGNVDPSQYTGTFRNFGTLIKSTGSGSASLNMVYLFNEPAGTVRVTSGKLFLNGGGFNQGTFQIGGGATLELGGGTNFQSHYFTSGSHIIGAANSELHVSNAQLYIQAGSTTHLDRFSIDNSFVSYEGGELSTGALTLNSASLDMTPGHDKTLKAKSITIVPFSESVLDMTDNKIIVDYDTGETGVADHIRQLIGGGYNGGGWDGEGIASSLADSTHFAIGYADNSVLGLPSFGGYDVDLTSVLIKYTYFGDSNLDGRVDILDIYNLASHFNHSGLWTDGDFNYNGFVDSNDLSLLAYNWQSGHLSPPLSEVLSQLHIPEPNLTCLLFGGLIALRQRRGTRRCDKSA